MANQSYSPLVSVIIPVFNGAAYLKEAVGSVLASSYTNLEILLIDDGSTDQSHQLCQHLAKQHDQISFYSFKQNRGLGRVLNFGLEKAQGKYICRLNQDDRMLKDRIATQVKYLESHPQVVALGSSIKLFMEDGSTQIVHYLPTDEQIKNMWLIVSPFSDPSVMYQRQLALSLGGYQQEFWPGDDTHLWIRMGMHGQLANIEQPLVEVRYHKNAASVKHWRKLTTVTYKLHRWMHREVQAAPIHIQLFWVGQLISGLILSPNLNWKVYRIIKKVIHFFNSRVAVFSHKIRPARLDKVKTQPTA